jgi:sugar lactone lactonase YvrE
MAEDDIARLLQNAEFEEILPEERNADGINVDKQQNVYCTSSNMNI